MVGADARARRDHAGAVEIIGIFVVEADPAADGLGVIARGCLIGGGRHRWGRIECVSTLLDRSIGNG